MSRFESLLAAVQQCDICEKHLPHGVRPVLQIDPKAKILIVGQAPGRKVHKSGVPFDDASGDRLRDWMGVTREVFYDAEQVAILPMGFCYPGTGKSGDLPPRSECAPAWRDQLLSHLDNVKLTLLVGQYAQAYHLTDKPASLTETVREWRTYGPGVIPIPHPSPRNNIWLSKNPWFEKELLKGLRRQVHWVLGKTES